MTLPSKIPLLSHPLNQDSVFRPDSLLAAVRAVRAIAERPIPRICVLDFDGDLTDWLVRGGRASRAKAWACFHTSMQELALDGVAAGVIGRTIGGPYAVLIAEQLLASGAEVIVGLTSAGRVATELPIPSLVVPERALRDEGTSFHYLAPGREVSAPGPIGTALASELLHAGLPVARGTVWTTDAPYRETAAQLEEHAASGVLAVEMQAASLFALAAAKNAQIGIVAHVTNAVDFEGPPFEKGGDELSFEILRRIVRAGARVLDAKVGD